MVASVNRLHHLDALRGLAALCVVGYHLYIYYGGSSVFSAGFLAVDFFFALSGFVMATCYDQRFAEGLATSQFLRIRLRRLWSAAAIGTLIGFAGYAGDGIPTVSQLGLLASGLLFVPTLTTPQIFVLNVAVWSLFFELFANVLHARHVWRVTNTRLTALAVVSFVLLLTAVAAYGSLDLGHDPKTFLGGFPRLMFSYAMGMLLYRIAWRPGASPWLAWLCLPGALLIASQFNPGTLRAALFVAIINPVLILIAAQSLAKSPMRSLAGGLGAISYPLYATHLPVIMFAIQFQLSLAMTLLAILATASLAAVATEPGLHARARRKLSSPRQNRSCQKSMPPI